MQENAEDNPCKIFTEIHVGFSAVVGLVVIFIGWLLLLILHNAYYCTLHLTLQLEP